MTTPLEESIARWERQLDASHPTQVRIGRGHCPLCKASEAIAPPCGVCPVALDTGLPYCRKTAYDQANQALVSWKANPYDPARALRWRIAAQAEIDYLRSLLPAASAKTVQPTGFQKLPKDNPAYDRASIYEDPDYPGIRIMTANAEIRGYDKKWLVVQDNNAVLYASISVNDAIAWAKRNLSRKFWVVVNTARSEPLQKLHRHPTLQAAEREAERLRAKYPSDTFLVMEAHL